MNMDKCPVYIEEKHRGSPWLALKCAVANRMPSRQPPQPDEYVRKREPHPIPGYENIRMDPISKMEFLNSEDAVAKRKELMSSF
jgi:hypothetical protein